MGYNFILSESEKREILNKHNSYKNFLNEEAVAPSIMDIQLKLIKLGFAELLGPTKADGKFGKYTCGAILSALTSLKQKRGVVTGGNTNNNMENMPKIKSGNDGTPKEGDGRIPGKIYPMGNDGLDVS